MEDLHKLHKCGTQLFEEGKYIEAEPVLKEVVNKNPEYADVHNKLGIISHLKGNFQQACEYFENTLKMDPKYTEASLNLAIAYFEKALKQNPDLVKEVEVYLGLFKKEGK